MHWRDEKSTDVGGRPDAKRLIARQDGSAILKWFVKR
jgi:hypothetical protein